MPFIGFKSPTYRASHLLSGGADSNRGNGVGGGAVMTSGCSPSIWRLVIEHNPCFHQYQRSFRLSMGCLIQQFSVVLLNLMGA
jgi:hypothetical protein